MIAQTRKWEPYAWPLLTAVLLLLLWHFSVKLTGTDVFPSPLSVQRGLTQLIEGGVLWRYVGDSLGRVGV
jgi:NitT/TauT family transport system permease protein